MTVIIDFLSYNTSVENPYYIGYFRLITSTRDKVNSQYINGCNPHLTSRFCGVELGLKPTSNMVLESFFKKIKLSLS